MHQWGRDAARRIQPLIFILSCALFSWHLGRPTTFNFDESHYVPAARDFLQGKTILNREHPPVAKYFMALGLDVLGDEVVSGRLMSVLFGSLTMVAVVSMAEAFEFTLAEQWMIALLTLTNCMFFIIARICMLDIYLMFFLWAGLASFVEVWRNVQSRETLIFCGASLGLAMACKWSAVYSWAGLLALVAVRIFLRRREPDILKNAAWLVVGLLFVPILVYYLAYIPLWIIGNHGIPGPMAFWEIQREMYVTHSGNLKPHNYQSAWYTWPILQRPVWFKFDKIENVPNDMVQTCMMIGNPWLAWLGLLAFGYCVYEFIRLKNWVPGLIAFFYGCALFAWAFVPRRQVEFIYYYLPAYLMLGYACVYALRKWPKTRIAFVVINALFFVYFYPIISGGPIHGPLYNYWIWFNSWR